MNEDEIKTMLKNLADSYCLSPQKAEEILQKILTRLKTKEK